MYHPIASVLDTELGKQLRAMKKRIIYCLFALCVLGTVTSCSIDENDQELFPAYNTGDEGDDPIPPNGGN